jgi:hypothetical protein
MLLLGSNYLRDEGLGFRVRVQVACIAWPPVLFFSEAGKIHPALLVSAITEAFGLTGVVGLELSRRSRV